MKTLTLFTALILTASLCFAQAPAWKWANQSIGDGHDYGLNIATDGDGNSYVTGTFQPPYVIIGSDSLSASTSFNESYFVAKYDRDGHAIWARTISGSAMVNATGITLNDAGDEIVISGYFKSIGYINFGSDSISSGTSFYEVFITKYDTSGSNLWTHNAGPSSWNGQNNFDVKMDAAQNLYVAGPFEDSLYLKKFDPSGAFLWSKKYSGNMNNTFFWTLDVNPAGESVVAGYFANTSLTFDTTIVGLNSNGYTIILVKCDAQGNLLWVKNDGQVASLYKPDITLDDADNIYVTGYFNGLTCVFGNTTLYNQGADDIFLVKYDASGNFQWAQSAGGFHFDLGISVTTDHQSNCYLTGMWRAVCSFGPHFLVNNGDPDIFITKFDANGNPLWAKAAGGDLVDISNAIALDDSLNCYITGCFTSQTPAFDNITLNNSSPQWQPYEFFIAKLGADSLTGISEIQNQEMILYPNPLVTESQLFIASGSVKNTLEIYDIRGALVKHQEFTGNETTIQREHLSSGTYVVRVISEKAASKMLMIVE